MARPATPNSRVITACVKITREEAQDLAQQYGTPGKGLRALIDQKKAQEGKR